MSQETLEAYFVRRFRPVHAEHVAAISGRREVPGFLQEFWKEVGFGRREDGFLWLLNPVRFDWLPELFGRPELIPFARNSFDEVYLLSGDGVCYHGSASDFQLNPISVDFETTVMNLSRRSATDDEIIYERHQAMWNDGKQIGAEQCYCLKPAIPVGGDYETSEIYIGNIKEYFLILRGMQP